MLQVETPAYEDPPLASGRSSNTYLLTVPQGQQPMSSPASAGGPGPGFGLSTIHDEFSLGENQGLHSHAYRSSNVCGIASSSMMPQDGGPLSGGSFPAPPGVEQQRPSEGMARSPTEKTTRDLICLNTPEEIHYMQVFIKEVGIWMDSLDYEKHFSRVVPFLALKSPMLLNALLACGAKQLTLVDPELNDDMVLRYYDLSTTQLLRSLQNPDRHMAECATTAVVLNVYEIMSAKPTARMSHIAGARALIRECGWNAKSTGIARACFWINIGMEVLSCLSFNWQTAWDPDQWGLSAEFMDMDAASADSENGGTADRIGSGREEEDWVHRMFYIVARIANFRANIPRFQDPSPHDEQVRLESRFAEWQQLKALCDSWNYNCPRNMQPFGHAPPTQGSSTKSRFPNVWYELTILPLLCSFPIAFSRQ